MIPHRFSELTAEPRTTSKYAKVWKDQANLGEEGDGATDVCIKVIKTEKLHKVGELPSVFAVETHCITPLRNSVGRLRCG